MFDGSNRTILTWIASSIPIEHLAANGESMVSGSALPDMSTADSILAAWKGVTNHHRSFE